MAVAKLPIACSLSIASLFSVQAFSAPSAQAAAFADAFGDFAFESFSTAPFGTNSSVFTSSFSTGSGSSAIVNADALFTNLPSTQAVNVISNTASSPNTPGSALAESEASVIGSFAIAPNSSFSFDFFGSIDLVTAINQPSDTASAVIETRYVLFDETVNSSTTEPGTQSPLDFLSLYGEINTPTGADVAEVDHSEPVTFSMLDIVNDTGSKQSEESIFIDVAGRYNRFFEQPTILTLLEIKQGIAFSKSQDAVDVPESSSPFVWLVGISGALMLSQRRRVAPRFTQ
ncbi:MAG: hypothetical protein AAGC93_07495 [Cyanobacteria bacterium P01_F01_bin.53]